MFTKQAASLFLLFAANLHATGNVDPFFSKRTISNTHPQINTSPARPPTQPAPVKPKPFRPPAQPTPAKPQQAKPKNATRAIATAVAPHAIVATAAWYTDMRVYYIGAGIIGLSAAVYALYWWNNQNNQSVAESTITPVPDDTKILFHACLSDHIQKVQSVLDRNPSLIEALNHEGVTPLIAASSNGSYKAVIELLNRNALIDAAVHNGTTALKVAAAHGHVAVVKELIKRGASMEPTAQTPFSVLMVAVWHGQLEVVKVLLDNGADLHTQVSFSALDIAQRVMQTDLTPREHEVYRAIVHELNKK